MANMQEKKPLTHAERIRIAVAAAFALLLLGAAAATWYFRDELFGAQEHILSVGQTESRLAYSYEPGAGQCFAMAGKNLAAVTGSGFSLFGPDGTLLGSTVTALQTPTVDGCAAYAAVFDQGGQSLWFADADGSITSRTAAGDILCLHCSPSGHAALVTREAGYKAVVTVLDSDHSEVWRWYCSTAYVVSARVSPDGRMVAILCLDSEGSEVRLFSLASETQQAAFSVSATVCADLHWFSAERICVYSAERVQFFSADGVWSATYDFAENYPIFCKAADSFLCLALSPYRSGSVSTVVALDSSGREIAAIDEKQEILSLDAANGEILIFDTAGAAMYSSTGVLRGRLADVTGFRSALIRNKGEALLLASGFAEVYKF